MRKRIVSLSIVVALLILAFALGVHAGSAGNGEPPAPPDLTSSYTLEDIYNRLDTGAAGSQNPFAEPANGPGTGTMHTLDDIVAIAPAVDNTNGAAPSDVLSGRTFWSLRTNSAWGPQTGSMLDNGAVTYTPNTTDQPVAAGYHNGSGYVAGDADLVPGNIISDVNIFGVTGTYPLAPLPKTGQTECYTETVSSEQDCPAVGYPGQDGDYQKGVTWPNPRFTIHDNDTPEFSDDTVTDNLTGLMWMRIANVGNDCAGADTGIETWVNALASAAACNTGAGLAGHTDWRLPNVRELQSLIHYGVDYPVVPNTAGTGKWEDKDPFIGVQSSLYWSSTSLAEHPEYAWYVFLGEGYVNYLKKFNAIYVWPVRGGQ